MNRNIARLKSRIHGLGAILRPHLKTAKSVEVARRLMESPQGPAAVSTLKEAEQFANVGVKDILYAVGIAPGKLGRVAALRAQGVDLAVLLDSLDQARAVAVKSREIGAPIPALIEIDADGHRSGVKPGDPVLVEIGRALEDGGAALRGVMAHAGDSYNTRYTAEIVAAADQERAAVLRSAAGLREVGLPCPIISVGSTPTAHFGRDLSGVTEVRAGVFVFFDLMMVGLGVCQIDDIALSVLATVIGHQRDKGQILVDAGWMAMSADRGTAKQEVDQGFGLIGDIDGRPYPDLILSDANQEHGIISVRTGSGANLPELEVGSLVRILPNHACATGAQHDRYHVVTDGSRRLEAIWPRFSGW